MRNWRKSHPDPYNNKVKARKLAAMRLRRGTIKREPCSVCGDYWSQMHHPDYSRPAEVVWLCQKHHTEVHWAKA